MSFSSFGLSEPLLRVLTELDYAVPTPIQRQAIPAVLSGRDVLAAAQTGTGKTAGFAVPLLQRLMNGERRRNNQVRVLILAPTRELAVQIAESVAGLHRYLPLKSAVVYGGVKINPQMMALRGGLDVLVGTPGRLLDLYQQNALKFDDLETLVLDEADRMLDLGFSDEINKILALLPQRRQNLLFSATFSAAIRTLAGQLLHQPVQIEVSPANSAAITVRQHVYSVDRGRKAALLSHLIRTQGWAQILVFTRTKEGADRLAHLLENDGFSAAVIHGGKSQSERSRALATFKANRNRVLVATDVAARGLDIVDLPYVVNFDLPKVAQDYIHRIGRTGRAGSAGQAISLVSADEINLLSAIEALTGQAIERAIESGFEPQQILGNSIQRTLVIKKPKKIKSPTRQSPAQPAAASGAAAITKGKPQPGSGAAVITKGKSQPAKEAAATAKGKSRSAKEVIATAKGKSRPAKETAVVAKGKPRPAKAGAATPASPAAALRRGEKTRGRRRPPRQR